MKEPPRLTAEAPEDVWPVLLAPKLARDPDAAKAEGESDEGLEVSVGEGEFDASVVEDELEILGVEEGEGEVEELKVDWRGDAEVLKVDGEETIVELLKVEGVLDVLDMELELDKTVLDVEVEELCNVLEVEDEDELDVLEEEGSSELDAEKLPLVVDEFEALMLWYEPVWSVYV